MTGRQPAGFTIIEMMIAIVILAILASLGAPSFRQFIVSSQVRSAASEFYEAAVVARSSAIVQNAPVSIVPCTAWASGWEVQQGSGAACTAAGGAMPSTVIKKHEAITNVTVIDSGAGNITYALSGRVSSGVLQLTFYSSSYSGSVVGARCVYIDAAGRPTVRSDNDNDPTNGCV